MDDYETTYLKSFGKRVRLRRIALGLSQEQLAEMSSLHRTYIGGIERGERNVGLKNILRISMALGVSVSELIPE